MRASAALSPLADGEMLARPALSRTSSLSSIRSITIGFTATANRIGRSDRVATYVDVTPHDNNECVQPTLSSRHRSSLDFETAEFDAIDIRDSDEGDEGNGKVAPAGGSIGSGSSSGSDFGSNRKTREGATAVAVPAPIAVQFSEEGSVQTVLMYFRDVKLGGSDLRIFIQNMSSQILECVWAAQEDVDFIPSIKHSSSNDIVASSFKSRKIMRMSHVSSSNGSNYSSALTNQQPFSSEGPFPTEPESTVCVPIFDTGGMAVGVVQAISRVGEKIFKREDEVTLALLGKLLQPTSCAMHAAMPATTMSQSKKKKGWRIWKQRPVNDSLAQSPSAESWLSVSLRILIADTVPSSRKLLKHMLVKLGHKVEIVTTGSDALRTIASSFRKESAFDVVFLDSDMPLMSGPQTVQELVSIGFEGDIVGFCAHGGSDIEAFLAAGVCSLFEKPLRVDVASCLLQGEICWPIVFYVLLLISVFLSNATVFLFNRSHISIIIITCSHRCCCKQSLAVTRKHSECNCSCSYAHRKYY